jgi:release factor glutamine methyltransferase
MNRVYLASEDSLLLRRVLLKFSGQTCLEIGSGNGGNLSELVKRFSFVVGTDIVRPEMPMGGSEFVLADRASCFRNSTFDLVAFNPPYLPSEDVKDPAVDGGRDGVDAAVAFLEEAVRVVKGTGTIVILLSSYNPRERIELICREHGLAMTLEDSEMLFYENIAVYGIRSAPK